MYYLGHLLRLFQNNFNLFHFISIHFIQFLLNLLYFLIIKLHNYVGSDVKIVEIHFQNFEIDLRYIFSFQNFPFNFMSVTFYLYLMDLIMFMNFQSKIYLYFINFFDSYFNILHKNLFIKLYFNHLVIQMKFLYHL